MKKTKILFVVMAMLMVAVFVSTVAAQDKTFASSVIGAKFVLIPAGTFMMGDVSEHQVTISKPYYMETTEVTQGQWRKVMGNNPSVFSTCGDNCPVENVSWGDAQEFIRRLNQKEGINKYRLPTEAEWEFACRAGAKSKEAPGSAEGNLGDYAWYEANSDRKTHPVAVKKPNPWGLYDMHGNVLEWCQDWQDDYPEKAMKDPKGPPSGQHKILRGGAWLGSPTTLRCTFRSQDYGIVKSNDIGFRLARDP
ncbi:MAG TPA: formylglycine-generating enzyme family protein [Syntrophales bacterium]|nr:formylglycine-generating enzyme family protein [Syntrophales bacterium]